MLEKNENILYFDAHFHLADCIEIAGSSPVMTEGISWAGCSCSHSIEEWDLVMRFRNKFGITTASQTTIVYSYGLHPQSAGWIDVKQCADFLEQLLQQNRLNAIGEAGFDYFTPEFREYTALQEEMFNIQLELALKYNMPMVIHARKANHKLFEYSRQFKKLPAVLFHSYMGPAREAQSLIDHGIKAYFSFGKQLMNKNKKVLDCAKNLPLQNLILETDAPFQYLKGEKFTSLQDIKKVYDAFIQLRKESRDEIFEQLGNNFRRLFS